MFTFRRHGHKLLFGDILVVLARYTTCNTAREVQYCTVRDLPFPCPNSDCARAQSDLRNMTHYVSRPLHTESVHKKGYRFLAGCKNTISRSVGRYQATFLHEYSHRTKNLTPRAPQLLNVRSCLSQVTVARR